MSINEKESLSESDDRAIQVTNCTIYVGRVRIVIDPRFNADVTGIAETRATQDHDGPAANTPPKQTDFVEPRRERQPITTPCAARPKTTKARPTSRQLVCLRTATSQLSCCLHGGGRCNYEARFGAGSNNYITGTDDFKAPAKNGYPSLKNISRRSPIWMTKNGGQLSPLRLVSRGQSVVISDRSTPSRTLVPFPSQFKPPSRQDKPVDLYSGSKLPVPVRPGPVTVRIPRINRDGDGLLLSLNNGKNGRRCATADISHHPDDGLKGRRCATADRPLDTNDRPHDTDDRPHDTDDRPTDNDNMWHDSADGPRDTDDRQNDIIKGPQDIDNRQKDLNDGQHDTDDRLHDVIDLLDNDNTAVIPRQQCMYIDESASSSTSEQWCNLQALDDLGLTGSQPAVVNSESLSDAPDYPTLQLISQNEFGDQCVSLFPDDLLA